MSWSIPLMRESGLSLAHACPLELFDCKVGVGENANLAGDAHGLHGQILGIEFRMLHKRAGGRERKSPSGTDGDNSIIGLDDIAVPGENEGTLGVRDDQQRLQMAKSAVLAPFLGEFD